MMTLQTQITTLLVSIGFGFLFSLCIDMLHPFLFKLKKIWQGISSFFLILSGSVLYFFVLLKLNNAIIHPYYIIAFLIGFFIEIVVKKTSKKIIFSIKNKNKNDFFHK